MHPVLVVSQTRSANQRLESRKISPGTTLLLLLLLSSASTITSAGEGEALPTRGFTACLRWGQG